MLGARKGTRPGPFISSSYKLSALRLNTVIMHQSVPETVKTFAEKYQDGRAFAHKVQPCERVAGAQSSGARRAQP